MKLKNKIDKIEDAFLEKVEDTSIEDGYFKFCQYKQKFVDVFWYGPKNFLHNIWKYKKLMWNDKWYDYVFLFEFMKTKLDEDSKMYRKAGVSVDSYKVANQMDECVNLLNRLILDNYDEKYLEEWYKEFNHNDTSLDYFMDRRRLRKVQTNAEWEYEKKKYRDAIDKAQMEKRDDLERVFKTITENFEYWWD